MSFVLIDIKGSIRTIIYKNFFLNFYLIIYIKLMLKEPVFSMELKELPGIKEIKTL